MHVAYLARMAAVCPQLHFAVPIAPFILVPFALFQDLTRYTNGATLRDYRVH